MTTAFSIKFSGRKKSKKFYLKYLSGDYSAWTLIASNLIMILLAIEEKWNVSTLMWIYWFQSVIIGIVNFIRILGLKDFSTENFRINDRPATPTNETKVKTALFFAMHYGLFHLVYMFFLLIPFWGGRPNIGYVLASATVFLANHLFSFFYNREQDSRKQNIGRLMFFPYARIIPMHLTIIFGGMIFSVGSEMRFPLTEEIVLALFLGLKTLADLIMHTREHA